MKKLILFILVISLVLPSVSLADIGKTGVTDTFLGKWSYYFDAREYNKVSLRPADYDIESAELLIFENGSCYFSSFIIANGKVEANEPILGMWIGDDNAITMRFGDQIFKASYSPMTGMILQTLTDTYNMVRVPSYKPFEQ